MPRDEKGSNDLNGFLDVFGRIGAAWLAAGADLWSRSAEVGSRRLTETMSAATGAEADQDEPRRGLDALLQRYRDYLGEMSLAAPLAAQRFSRELATPRGDRLLFSAKTDDNSAWDKSMPALSGLRSMEGAKAEPARSENGGVTGLLMTQKVLDILEGAAGRDARATLESFKKSLEDPKRDVPQIASLPALQEDIRAALKRISENAIAGEKPFRVLEESLVKQNRSEEAVEEVRTRLTKALGDSGADVERVLSGIATALGVPGGSTEQLLASIAEALGADGASLQKLVQLLDLFVRLTGELDYATLQRKQSRSLLEQIKREVGQCATEMVKMQQSLDDMTRALEKQGPGARRLPALLETLKQSLGERAVEGLLDEQVLASLAANWYRKNELVMQDEHDLLNQLKEAFGQSGIQLSKAITVVCRGSDWAVGDHDKDRVFNISLVREVDSGKGVQRPVTKGRRGRASTPRLRLDVFGREEGRDYEVPDRGGGRRRILLPLRVHDAAQGMAVYSVRKDRVQDALDALPGKPFKAWDIGSRRTAAAIVVVDYRETDLDDYRELGVGCLVTPRSDPLAVGLYVLALPVTSELSKNAGVAIWGYPKTVEDSLAITYCEDEVTCELKGKTTAGKASALPPVLKLTLPRGGSSSSAGIPIYTYTQKNGLYHRTIFMRNGRGEMVRRGGRGVRLEVDFKQGHDLLDQLDTVGITPHSTPIFTSWTERMSGECQAPVALDLFDEDDPNRPGAKSKPFAEETLRAAQRNL